MEKIELRSEKVRNIIGAVPPILVRIGNICLITLLATLFTLAYFIKVPNVVDCNVIVDESDNDTRLLISSCSKIVNKIIPKGTMVSVYKNNDLLFTATLSQDLDHIGLTEDNYEVSLPIEVPENIMINNTIQLELKNNASLNAKIELDNHSILQNVFSK
ncbi:hypothetical protein [Bacteroides pyogenes]|uniref:Uncharacterized protein n=2 Tax=Bacteroides pyogenes TaxID=310300 RepID=W4PKE3_9BACE|nr:hypothetical protein [Bacteroides pyogenes]GAE16489.1 hypothetical protein JCM6292_2925 [Bacteroides pyogenes JCM 6292]MBR8726046.1 hypothetical protein [Bacteroides pyogenes]MBR8739349.1 hypothetical protein [Bacteroides pyogenes]MBR8755210.1 hypothetical protein [Bacteroides pyogenes]MBR8796538.1 hypothetical protein [Bacteroides pyogenes]